MMPIAEMSAADILKEEIFEELINIADPIAKSTMIVRLGERAKELKVKAAFDTMLRGCREAEREMKREAKKQPVTMLENYTNFTSGGKYDRLACGSWIAGDDGVYSQSSGNFDGIACYHPIMPIKRLKNLETGEEKITLAYCRGGVWYEKTVDKTIIASANRIVALASYGVSVTSENARLLVKYLSDVENLNDTYILVEQSSGKLGWHGADFIPYDTEIIFDGQERFRHLFEAIRCYGDYEIWLEHVRSIRQTGRIEPRMMMAASFASVLLHQVGSLPFICDLWGETEGGKTVCLMLAASIWANPDENQFIGDFKSTEVALETRADMLNHLPMLLDDTSKVSKRIRDNFEGVVYDLCSGKGKSRSNKELGANRENHWRNVILCNGERPLQSYVVQGGAVNRILEIECGDKVFEDPQKTAETVKKNYGFAGRLFVEAVKELGAREIKRMAAGFQKELMAADKMEKQAISLSLVLTADKIAADYIFKDQIYITLDEARETLINRDELSDNVRCYNYLLDKIGMNNIRFEADTKVEKWGVIDNGYVYMYPTALHTLCEEGGFSDKSFKNWAIKNGLAMPDSQGKSTRLKKIDGRPVRCFCMKVDVSEDNFIEADADSLGELPFK